MSKSFVFKQWYKPCNVKSTPTLNRKHLNYIASRKGAIRNAECSFGLFGRLPDMDTVTNIDNLKRAKDVVSEVSKRRTVYRAVLSVDDDTAINKDLYNRDTWQELVTNKISIIAKEMNIDEKDFCFTASMHYAKGHPHVHIMYWDNGYKVRQEFVPEKRFGIMAEHVRAEFGREVFKEEIQEHQNNGKKTVQDIRLELSAMLVDCNLIEALNLNNVSEIKLNEIGNKLYELIKTIPPKGSLKYKFLSEEMKQRLDSFSDEILKISDFKKLLKRYIKDIDAVSEYYGNADEKMKFNRSSALKQLHTEMGNEILKFAKGIQYSLTMDMPQELIKMKEDIKSDIRSLISKNSDAAALYGALKNKFPKERTPLKEIVDEQFDSTKSQLVQILIKDFRICSKMSKYTETAAELAKEQGGKDVYQKDLIEKADENAKDLTPPHEGLKTPEQFFAEHYTDKEFAFDYGKQFYGDLIREANKIVFEALYEDAKYDEQFKRDAAMDMLINLFGCQSQRANHMHSRSQLHIRQRGSLSKTAKRDIAKERESSGDWELDR